MVEFVRHALGICGEHWHPNIFTLTIAAIGGSQTLNYLKGFLTVKRRKDDTEARTA